MMCDLMYDLYYLYLYEQFKLIDLLNIKCMVLTRIDGSRSPQILSLKGYYDQDIKYFLIKYGQHKKMVFKDD
jgi:hypothetical protein